MEPLGSVLFYPSVSSVKTNFRPSQYVGVLSALSTPRYLVSAYDIARADDADRSEMLGSMKEAQSIGTDVLLDCGNYESYWKKDAGWDRGSFHAVASKASWRTAFAFDEQYVVADSVTAAANRIVEGVERDRSIIGRQEVAPIVHAATDVLPTLCGMVASRLQPPLLAVAERELGEGMTSRVSTISHICDALHAASPCTRLHVLGTGNPLSLVLFAAVGAASFDGLEWCQTSVDHSDARLYHFQHFEFFSYQSGRNHDGLSFATAALSHNLAFFERFIIEIDEHMAKGAIRKLLAALLPVGALENLDAMCTGAKRWPR